MFPDENPFGNPVWEGLLGDNSRFEPLTETAADGRSELEVPGHCLQVFGESKEILELSV